MRPFRKQFVFKFNDLTEVGPSKLLPNSNGLSFKMNTSELEPGTAVTVWMMIFKKPENCTDREFGSDDISDPGARAAVMTDVVLLDQEGLSKIPQKRPLPAIGKGGKVIPLSRYLHKNKPRL